MHLNVAKLHSGHFKTVQQSVNRDQTTQQSVNHYCGANGQPKAHSYTFANAVRSLYMQFKARDSHKKFPEMSEVSGERKICFLACVQLLNNLGSVIKFRCQRF